MLLSRVLFFLFLFSHASFAVKKSRPIYPWMSDELQSFLKEIPIELFSSGPISFESALEFKIEQKFSKKFLIKYPQFNLVDPSEFLSKPEFHKSFNTEAADDLFNFFKDSMLYKGDYFFIGNGMHFPKLYADEFFKGTLIAKQIKQMNISRPLLENVKKKSLFQYFEQLNLGSVGGKKIMLIDSVSQPSPGPGGAHSLEIIADYVIEYLISKGIKLEEAIKMVVPIGIAEGTGLDMSQNFSEYVKKKMKYLADKKYVHNMIHVVEGSYQAGVRMISNFYFAPRWNDRTKFVGFRKGIPYTRGESALKELIEEQNSDLHRYYITFFRRLKHIVLLQELSRASKEVLKLKGKSKEINSIVKKTLVKKVQCDLFKPGT